MGFKTDIKKNKIRKIVLLELNIGFAIPLTEWVKYCPGVWSFKFYNINNDGATVSYNAGTGAAGHFSAGSSGTGKVPTLRYKTRVGSFIASGINHTTASSISGVISAQKSYYWDHDDQTIYVHFNNNGTPFDQSNCTIGILNGFCKNSKKDNSGNVPDQYFNDIYYDGRLLSVPSLTKKRNPLFFGTTSIGDLTFTLDNSDGYFNNFRDNDIFGMRIQLKVGLDGMDYDDFLTRYTGVLDDYSLDNEKIIIKAIDDQSIFTRKIGINYLSVDDYPNLDEKNEGKSLPLAWGFVDRQEAVCLNEEQGAASTFNFIFVDTSIHDIYSISQVYVDGVEVSHSNGSISLGTFDLSNSNYEPGQDVTISFYGFVDSSGNLIEHPLKVIEDVLLNFEEKLVNGDFYDIISWTQAINSIDYKISYSTGFGQKSIDQIISDMGQAAYGSFEVMGNGLYTFRRTNRQGSVLHNIRFYHLERSARELSEGKKYYCSSAKIGYAPWNENKFKYIFDRSREAEITTKHRKYKEKEIKTFLQTKENAEAWGLQIVTDFGGSLPNYNILVPYELYFINLNDIAICEIIEDDIKNEVWGFIKGEVISITENLNDFNIELTIRFIENASGLSTELYTVVDSNQDISYTVTDDSSIILTVIDN